MRKDINITIHEMLPIIRKPKSVQDMTKKCGKQLLVPSL